MEIVIAAVVVALGLAAGLVVAALLLAKRMPGGLQAGTRESSKRTAEAPPLNRRSTVPDGALVRVN